MLLSMLRSVAACQLLGVRSGAVSSGFARFIATSAGAYSML